MNLTLANPHQKIAKVEVTEEGVVTVVLANGLTLEIDTVADFQAVHYGVDGVAEKWLTFEQLGVPADRIDPRP